MMSPTRENLFSKLQTHYGPWRTESSQFGDASYGSIAADLCISASQFSKLISGAATAGMYERSTRNVEQLVELAAAHRELARLNAPPEPPARANPASRKLGRLSAALFGLLLLGGALWTYARSADAHAAANARTPGGAAGGHPLAAYFDRTYSDDFVSPYLAPGDLTEFCPCAGYEGEWELAGEFVIPMPGNRPGLYYRATAADVRMKCAHSVTDSTRGRVLYGFQYLDSELWVDRRRRPLSPEYFDAERKTFTDAYHAIDFEGDPDFAKLADVRSIFLDHLSVYPDSIVRRGEPTGRYAENVDQALADEYEVDPREVLRDVLGNMTATSCGPAANPFCDPNTLVEGESELAFDCFFTIDGEHLGMGGGYPYRKTLRLKRQHYVDHLPCGCDERVDPGSDLADKAL